MTRSGRFDRVFAALFLLSIVYLMIDSERIEEGLWGGALDGAKPRFDLGVARFPSQAGLVPSLPALTTAHAWRHPDSKDLYRVAYAHGEHQIYEIEGRLASLARRFRFERAEAGLFRWRPPQGCEAAPWSCIYAEVLEDNRDSLGPLVDRFAERFALEGWNRADAARWALAFVQRIPYEIPRRQAFGIQPPSLVVSRDQGDCDSKALLLIAILERIGVDSVLVISDAHAHAMVGIAVPSSGEGFTDRGREYAWAETTARVPLGLRHGGLREPDDWAVVLRR